MMSERIGWERGPWPAQAPISAETYYRERIEELKAQLAVREDEVVGADRTVDILRGKLVDANKLAKRRLGETQRLEQKLQSVNNKLAAKEEAVKRQGQMLIEFEKEIRDHRSAIDNLDAELDKCKGTPSTRDSKMHIAAAKTLQGMGYFYNGAELWKPPVGVPAKHIAQGPEPMTITVTVLDNASSDVQGLYAADQIFRALKLYPEDVKRILQWLGG